MVENNDAPQIPHKKPDSEIGKAGEPGAAGKRLHDEASKEWFREAKEARKAPLIVGEDQKYTVQHGDCLSDIALRRLHTDKEKVDGHSIAKEEKRLRELNSGQFHSLDSKGVKRDFLGDGWHLKIYDSVHTKQQAKPEPTNLSAKPEAALDVPPLPVPRPKQLPTETPPADMSLPPGRPKLRPGEPPPAAPSSPERQHATEREDPHPHHLQTTDHQERHHRQHHGRRRHPHHQSELPVRQPAQTLPHEPRPTPPEQPPQQSPEPSSESKPTLKEPERVPTVGRPQIDSHEKPLEEGVRRTDGPRAGDPVPPGTLGSLTLRPDGTPVTPVYIGMPGEAALKANGTDTTTHDLRGHRIEIAGVSQWLDGGKNHDGPAYAYMAASKMLGRHIPLQTEGVSPHDSQNSAGRTDLQAHICSGLCSHSNHNHWGGAIDVKDDDLKVRQALEAVGFRNTGRNFNDPHHWDWRPTPEQRRLVASFGARVNDSMVALNP